MAIPSPSASKSNYVEPHLRQLQFRAPVVPGYITARLAPRKILTSPLVYVFGSAHVKLTNPGDSTVVVKFVDAENDQNDTARNSIGSAIRLVGGGTKLINLVSNRAILELKGIYGTGSVLVEMGVRQEYDIVGFSEDYDTLYPRVLWAADPGAAANLPAKSASQSFTAADPWVVTHSLGFEADFTALDAAGNDITSLATPSAVGDNGYTLTFGSNKTGIAYSYK